jgi:hypothetical protein
MTHKNKDDQLAELRGTVTRVEERCAELERDLLIRTQSAELGRARDVIKALQTADVAQRKTIDNLAGETYELRRIMRESKAFDMSEVQGTVSESLHRYRLAVEEDR